ncbi:serine family D-Ala-D-Ala carboxypeptidase [Limosilactobacillus frumenti DSM 13145]|uniref:serine-type D-Ala-D-Ala carboxypeptidase n=1 Tax=Limosilactobacillus frumenti DSM 13145 TaxID=1423746 RepID=A0A0R1P638_9LACO|nr:serine family D-Ala-D-Ala carboxypeptidase [Limosilactobacillus frumenti DSM 13145]MBA2913475.1 D-alanyl-D-alanine carboxypeptidase [Limosilactobacillus frumenti]QFG73140.1 D-alanyl-D-alanine carboxypeptidase [Limosilactobacillus frumenti]
MVQKVFRWLVIMATTVLIVSSALLPSTSAQAAAFKLNARSAYAIDAQTGQVLYQKNARKKYPVASLTKVLTLAVIEQDVAAHKLRWNQKVKVTPAVAKVANDWHFSNVQLNAGESYTVRQLAESMMIVSADGSTEALALADAGSTAAFNKKMQAVARKAGVKDAKIYNMIGLPNEDLGKNKIKGVDKDAENLFSARDMALISKYLIDNYPDALKITKTKFANFRVSEGQSERLVNINSLLPKNGFAPKNGEIDGLKTGNTDAAGKCIITTGTFDGRRIILVALHTKGDWNRQSKESKEFYEQLTDRYQPVTLNTTQQVSRQVQRMRVVHAKKRRSTKLDLQRATAVWVPKGMTWQQMKPSLIVKQADRSMTGSLKAPVKKGQQVGYLVLHPGDLPKVKMPVKALNNVQRSGWFDL